MICTYLWMQVKRAIDLMHKPAVKLGMLKKTAVQVCPRPKPCK